MPYKVVIRGSIGTKASSKISCVLFKVNTLIARELFGLYLHSFTNNELKFFNTAQGRVLTFLLFKLNTLQKTRLSSSQPKPWCNDRRLLHHNNDIKEVVSSQPSITW